MIVPLNGIEVAGDQAEPFHFAKPGTATSPASAAIANAVNDALAPLRVEVTELPITPRRLLALLQAKSGKLPE